MLIPLTLSCAPISEAAHLYLGSKLTYCSSRRNRIQTSARLVVALVNWSVVKDVGALSTTRAGTLHTAKKTFLRGTSTALNAASVATCHRPQRHLESWAVCLVNLSRQIQ